MRMANSISNFRNLLLICILICSVQSFVPIRLVMMTNPMTIQRQEYQTPFRSISCLDSTQSDQDDIGTSRALIGDDSAYFSLEEQVGLSRGW